MLTANTGFVCLFLLSPLISIFYYAPLAHCCCSLPHYVSLPPVSTPASCVSMPSLPVKCLFLSVTASIQLFCFLISSCPFCLYSFPLCRHPDYSFFPSSNLSHSFRSLPRPHPAPFLTFHPNSIPFPLSTLFITSPLHFYSHPINPFLILSVSLSQTLSSSKSHMQTPFPDLEKIADPTDAILGPVMHILHPLPFHGELAATKRDMKHAFFPPSQTFSF